MYNVHPRWEKTYSYDGNVAVFLLQPLDMGTQLEGLLRVAIPHAGVHQLGHLQHLQQLSVSLQGQRVHTSTGGREGGRERGREGNKRGN